MTSISACTRLVRHSSRGPPDHFGCYRFRFPQEHETAFSFRTLLGSYQLSSEETTSSNLHHNLFTCIVCCQQGWPTAILIYRYNLRSINATRKLKNSMIVNPIGNLILHKNRCETTVHSKAPIQSIGCSTSYLSVENRRSPNVILLTLVVGSAVLKHGAWFAVRMKPLG